MSTQLKRNIKYYYCPHTLTTFIMNYLKLTESNFGLYTLRRYSHTSFIILYTCSVTLTVSSHRYSMITMFFFLFFIVMVGCTRAHLSLTSKPKVILPWKSFIAHPAHSGNRNLNGIDHLVVSLSAMTKWFWTIHSKSIVFCLYRSIVFPPESKFKASILQL